MLMCAPILAAAAPYAALVMDMRTGEVLYSKNEDTRLHPASLTKMMTLYIAFQAIEHGEISLDSVVTVSANAASKPPSRLGLKTGQKIKLRYLIRGAALKSGNDAASAIGDALGGSEAGFAARMNATAKALGMKNSTFRNANGLTTQGHMSTARDMTLLGRHLFYDFPQYYNLFSRRSADAGIKTVYSTNRRFLDAYEGADGIKTGYTSAAGFNLTASAKRGSKRIIATVFGGTSTAQRNAKMAELMDLGFKRAPDRARVQKPAEPGLIAVAPQSGSVARVAAVKSSPRPLPRPGIATHDADAIQLALQAAQAAPIAPVQTAAAVAESLTPLAEVAEEAVELASTVASNALDSSPRPLRAPNRASSIRVAAVTPAPQPEEESSTIEIAQGEPDESIFDDAVAEGDAPSDGPIFAQSSTVQPETLAMLERTKPSDTMILAALNPPAAAPSQKPRVVARGSSSGGRNWSITLGLHNSEFHAQQALLKTALMESETLGDALRKVAKRTRGYEANFVGLTQDMASLACARLAARDMNCAVVGP
ncbi:D-alanyl-D-alanine carboxypeptidase family protein [Thioclava sp. SK-1]|uniref:D-alanyl-D-alanine carboxypeptidase family protein n=1 Tax=Thioclava sp. SK-1 TaxID=1889770 RepID=UPI0009F4FCD4|nr:D-alanyl-D-alanine carboxypeptidase family protein [Thioclava sp. SK-1]